LLYWTLANFGKTRWSTIFIKTEEEIMNKFFTTLVSMALILCVFASPVWAAGGKVRSDKAEGPAGATGEGKVETNRGFTAGDNIQALETLTQKEIEHIIFIREEEKLARDVYLTLYQSYETTIFANISESEQRHMDAMKRLIAKYKLEDPVEDDTVGKFTNQVLAELYFELVEKGEVNYCEALQVGIDIEVLDISDIEITLNEELAQDVNRVLNNLLNGSYNHLNAFSSQYRAAGCE
jgi:hypothetical protein